MYVHTPVSQDVIDKLGDICLALPEVTEEQAWVGQRWMVRKKNFAHVLIVDKGYPPTYARVAKVAKTDAAICVLTFRTPDEAHAYSEYAQPPYFLPGWWVNIVGVVINEETNWQSIAAHIEGSYRTLAPQRLIEQIGHTI